MVPTRELSGLAVLNPHRDRPVEPRNEAGTAACTLGIAFGYGLRGAYHMGHWGPHLEVSGLGRHARGAG